MAEVYTSCNGVDHLQPDPRKTCLTCGGNHYASEDDYPDLMLKEALEEDMPDLTAAQRDYIVGLAVAAFCPGLAQH